MLFNTKGLVIRTVRYGETSVIVNIFTELFGVRSYLVNGVRTSKIKNAFKPGMFQPGALLDLVVYEQNGKNLQRIKECKWAQIYQHIFSDMYKNAVALFMVELLQKCLKQPEPQPELFHFSEDAFVVLDQSSPAVTANFPMFYILHLSHFFGFRLEDTYSAGKEMIDLREGSFTNQVPDHPWWIGRPSSEWISDFLKAQHPQETEHIRLNQEQRRKLIDTCVQYYSLHFPDFGSLKSLPVLQTILG